MTSAELHIRLPEWVDTLVDWERPYRDDIAAMGLAIALAAENVRRQAGGPFAAVITEIPTGRLVAVGVNRVVPLHNSVLHGEVVAIMLAQARVGYHTLAAEHLPPHGLTTSCEPCAMCLGATLWSGVRRLVCGATKSDAEALGYDEGPVLPASYRHLEGQGIEIVREVRRAEARAVLAAYGSAGGAIY